MSKLPIAVRLYSRRVSLAQLGTTERVITLRPRKRDTEGYKELKD